MNAVLPHGFATLQEIDRAYDPLVTAADGAASNRHFERRSDHARRELPYIPGVPYGPTVAETLDILGGRGKGAQGEQLPVFFFIHGGYWRARTSADFSCVALGPHALGFISVIVNYALCPAVTVDEIVRQVRAAAAWVVRNIAQYGGDPHRIVIGGHSAGGQLGAMLLATSWAYDYGLPCDPFAGAVLVSGLYDIAPLRFSYLQPALQLDVGQVWRNSPVHHVRRSRTPALFAWGEVEQPAFAEQSRRMHAAWDAAGNDGQLAMLPGDDHFSAIQGFEDPQGILCQALRRFAPS